jgi:hypothetical protein
MCLLVWGQPGRARQAHVRSLQPRLFSHQGANGNMVCLVCCCCRCCCVVTSQAMVAGRAAAPQAAVVGVAPASSVVNPATLPARAPIPQQVAAAAGEGMGPALVGATAAGAVPVVGAPVVVRAISVEVTATGRATARPMLQRAAVRADGEGTGAVGATAAAAAAAVVAPATSVASPATGPGTALAAARE